MGVALATSDGDTLSYTYGTVPNKVETWDHDMIFGCYCDHGYYYEPDRLNSTDYKCSQRPCATGDNPRTDYQFNEVQTATCTATSGTFTLTFRSQTTAALSYDASTGDIMDALHQLSTISNVSVVFSTGLVACSGTGVGIAVTLYSELNDLPMMSAGVASLQGGAGTIH